MTLIVVAGATGRLGRCVSRALVARGHGVRALGRKTPSDWEGGDFREVDLLRPETVYGVCDGATHLFSAMGARVDLSFRFGQKSYRRVDLPAHRHLLQEARRAGNLKFVYVSVHHTAEHAKLAYVDAHEAFVRELEASPLESCVIRPTGFFSAFSPLLRFARLGIMPLIGSGEARTNPIFEEDLAEICVEALERPLGSVHAGGPEVLTRREILEQAFRAVGRKPRFLPVPPLLARAQASLTGLLDPRLGDLLRFFARVSVTDVVAPARGSSTLGEFFRESARSHGEAD